MIDSERAEALRKKSQEYRDKVASGEIQPLSPSEKAVKNPKSLRYAINAKCWDCVCFQKREVTLCEMVDCSLWKLRPWQNTEINKEILIKFNNRRKSA